MCFMKDGGIKIISLDALFGLPRRKLAGKSYRDALHGHLWFADQEKVDIFVETAQKTSAKHEKVSIEVKCTFKKF